MIQYLLGVATPFAALLALALIGDVYAMFTARSRGWGCVVCDKAWGLQGDGSVIAVAWTRKRWHTMTAHPGHRGRLLALEWRGWRYPEDWQKGRRLLRAFPSPPVTAWDVVARIPILSRIAFAIATRHGRKTR